VIPGAIQTFVLVLSLLTSATPVVVPGYGSAAECDEALRQALTHGRFVRGGVCLPGPAERR
jgi:hypothetical protein